MHWDMSVGCIVGHWLGAPPAPVVVVVIGAPPAPVVVVVVIGAPPAPVVVVVIIGPPPTPVVLVLVVPVVVIVVPALVVLGAPPLPVVVSTEPPHAATSPAAAITNVIFFSAPIPCPPVERSPLFSGMREILRRKSVLSFSAKSCPARVNAPRREGNAKSSGEAPEQHVITTEASSSIRIDVDEVTSGALELIGELTRREGPRAPEWLSSRDLVGPLSRDEEDAPVADPLIGRVVADRYRILEAIGRGGMGIVYKVEHTRIGKLLAMKLLTGELSSNPEVVRRFKREALAASKLQSPNTVQVFDFGVSDGLTYLVMELVSGDNLGRVLRAGGPMPFARLGKIVVQVCSSLAEAHRRGIVHRDIKPENIMLVSGESGGDVAKVLDFGLAKLRETEALGEVTGQGVILGTPFYMAPEQIRGDEVDARTDVYSVGALMYRMLTGHHPFGGTPMSVLEKHLHESPIPPCDRAPELGIPASVSRIVMRALRKNPVDRFQRAEDLRAALVEELRAQGSASVESLLDSARLARLTRTKEPTYVEMRMAIAAATRDEVDAYERKLRRTRWGAALSALALVAAAGAAVSVWAKGEAQFSGVEIEPNDTPAEATPIPLGRTVRGHLGRRLDSTHGDRDFYAFDLPARAPGDKAYLSLHVGALPNLPMCSTLYRQGFSEPLGQYCVGRPGRDLAIDALALEPGRYFLAVVQDLSAYGGAAPFVHENVSDTYAVLVEPAALTPGLEIEPNDQLASATPIAVGQRVSASIGWARDEDVFCVRGDAPEKVRWKVTAGPRDGALEATILANGGEGAPARVASDAARPYKSEPVPRSACVRVRLAQDPASPEARGGGGSERYAVEVEGAR
jgi:serine/threonine-protein kinase